MQIIIEPPVDRWQVGRDRGADRTGLIGLLRATAQRLGVGEVADVRYPVLATGHQAWLWHPGILAKDLAVSRAAGAMGAGCFHVVVDQDVEPALRLELPVRREGRLVVEVIELAPTLAMVPTGCQPAVDSGVVVRTLSETQQKFGAALAVDVGLIVEAFEVLPGCRTLAEQVTVVLARLRAAMIDHWRAMPVLFASEMSGLSVFGEVLDRVLADARACVEGYNRAAAAYPEAQVAGLRVESGRVELPVWWLRWGRPRQRVFAEMRGGRTALIAEDGRVVGSESGEGRGEGRKEGRMAPRALLMTAILRRSCCDLFVHGRGGAVYDRVTEAWWREWAGEELGPTAVASADVRLDFGVPVVDEDELQRAAWRVHHLPHNLDREVDSGGVDTEAAARKRWLVEHMNDDRDRRRRAAAFEEIHRINRQLGAAHRAVVTQAQEEFQRAKLGAANRDVAMKRDWCFALYRREEIRAMAEAVGR